MTTFATPGREIRRKRLGRRGLRSSLQALGSALVPILLFSSLSVALDDPFLSVTGPCNLAFPRDHGAHEGFHTEWWYYTGNLQSEAGDRYGFQLTFFRNQIAPPGRERSWPGPPSAWRTLQVYLAHAALSDMGAKRFHRAEKIARGALGMAGVLQEESATTIFLGDWSTTLTRSRQNLSARTDDFTLELSLTSLKDPILHGESGYSIKGKAADRASCYYSFTRLGAEGSLVIGKQLIPVRGAAWMDHEFSSSPLEADIVGWDWFSLQLSDNSELMIYLLRHDDGTYSKASSGTFVDADGRALHLSSEDFSVEVLDRWESHRSKAVYPSRWRIFALSLGLDLAVAPNLQDQELETPNSTQVTYWEGSVRASGRIHDRTVTGDGYAELTGYAGPLDALRREAGLD